MSLMKRGRDWWDWPFDINIRNLPSIFDINFPSISGLFSRPRVDIVESETEIVATAELPGVDKKDIEINVYDNILEIKGQTSVDEEKEDKNYYIRERYYGSFARRIELPAEVDPERTTAKFENGILKITMPKLHPSKPKKRKIDIE
ncbi:Hsp20/alpha crystallin family protein [Caldanaerobacter sp.]|uniref:Hsp20/alpha crystallin family protein n=1 Tax=Caldanaerobacter sp. TaxID=2930036 RepID=UPI003C711EAF